LDIVRSKSHQNFIDMERYSWHMRIE
jgi:hypothetical protein